MEQIKIDKRAVFDWISYSTAQIDKIYFNDILSCPFVKDLLDILKVPLCEVSVENTAINGFRKSLNIGEYIRLFFDSDLIKDNSGNYVSQLLMSGSACREYELFMNGNWNELLKFLIDKGKFKRVDIAIDDFQANEIDIYEIEKIMRKNYYVSSFRNRKFYISELHDTNTLNEVESDGFTIQLGNKGGNMLVIYDKLIERRKRHEPDLNVNTWYRYEIRITDEKAHLFVENYLIDYVYEDKSFLKLVSSVLLSYLHLKQPSKKDSNKSRWITNKKWEQFLGSLQKIDLKVKFDKKTSIESLVEWSDYSLSKVQLQLYITQGLEYHFDLISKGIEKIINDNDTKTLARINNFYEKNGKKRITMQELEIFCKNLNKNLDEDMNYED